MNVFCQEYMTRQDGRCEDFWLQSPKTLLKKLDNVRGDVNRSRYIQRLIENKIDTIPQIRPQVGPVIV